ncbi:hypothetical protein AJ79_10231 [Helicocarpus griseus UAMH5409]|uniref:Uncharacterized protein n=1 Tax=Helicocarpus griseus UAMH5409 TaxID=1447875 RepID=A0A2B7W6K5_9EURO|nr:hypothetical protein AJ79_10231 [Helicocarpus griseus UAMH5409]
MITAGGFLAVNYLKNRNATGDLDYLLAPEWAADEEIKAPLREAIENVAKDLTFNEKCANDDMSVFVTSKALKVLFQKAEEQDIVLFSGECFRVLAAPIEWALERKLRRLERDNGPLNEEYIRQLNVNGFDVVPDKKTMDMVATAYRAQYNEEIFGA